MLIKRIEDSVRSQNHADFNDLLAAWRTSTNRDEDRAIIVADIASIWMASDQHDLGRGLLRMILSDIMPSVPTLPAVDDGVVAVCRVVEEMFTACLRTSGFAHCVHYLDEVRQWETTQKMPTGEREHLWRRLTQKLCHGITCQKHINWMDPQNDLDTLLRWFGAINEKTEKMAGEHLFAYAVQQKNISVVRYGLARNQITVGWAMHAASTYICADNFQAYTYSDGSLSDKDADADLAALGAMVREIIDATHLTLDDALSCMSVPTKERVSPWRVNLHGTDIDFLAETCQMPQNGGPSAYVERWISLFPHASYDPKHHSLMNALARKIPAQKAPHLHSCVERHVMQQQCSTPEDGWRLDSVRKM